MDRYTALPLLPQLITSRGIKQAWLGRKLNMSLVHFHHIVHGRRTISRENAQRVADALNMPFFALFESTYANKRSTDTTQEKEEVTA